MSAGARSAVSASSNSARCSAAAGRALSVSVARSTGGGLDQALQVQAAARILRQQRAQPRMLRLAARVALGLAAPPLEPDMSHGVVEAASGAGADLIGQREQRGERGARAAVGL